LITRIAGLRERMKRFDADRGKPWQTPTSIEHRPLDHENSQENRKDQLH